MALDNLAGHETGLCLAWLWGMPYAIHASEDGNAGLEVCRKNACHPVPVRLFVMFRCHSLQDASDLALAETLFLSLRAQQWRIRHPSRSKILFGSGLDAF